MSHDVQELIDAAQGIYAYMAPEVRDVQRVPIKASLLESLTDALEKTLAENETLRERLEQADADLQANAANADVDVEGLREDKVRLDAQAAAMREALMATQRAYTHADVVPQALGMIQRALSPDAGRELLARLERAECEMKIRMLDPALSALVDLLPEEDRHPSLKWTCLNEWIPKVLTRLERAESAAEELRAQVARVKAVVAEFLESAELVDDWGKRPPGCGSYERWIEEIAGKFEAALADPGAAAESGETQATINAWQRATFPDGRSVEGYVRRAAEEMKELVDSCHGDETGAPGECADIVILLFGVAGIAGFDLMFEVTKKMAINRARKWKFRDDGSGHADHVKGGEIPEPAVAWPEPEIERVTYVRKDAVVRLVDAAQAAYINLRAVDGDSRVVRELFDALALLPAPGGEGE